MLRSTLALSLVTACAAARGAGVDGAVPVATDRVIVRVASQQAWPDLEADLERADARLEAILTAAPLRVLIRMRSPAAGARIAAELEASGRVAYAVPETFRPMELRGRHVPNDPLFAAQWALDNADRTERPAGGDVDAPRAWGYTLGSPAVTIAVLDDGVQLDHPDLEPNIASAGRDFTVYPPAEGAGPRVASDRHGTSVAGIAAARGDNGLGVSGICPRCRILPIRVHGSSNIGVAEAFRYAVAQGADVITNSWGYAPSGRRHGAAASVDAAVRDAIDSAAREGRGGRGTVIVFGMTNEPVDNCGAHPDISALESVVAVGVSDRDDRIGGSGFGECMDIVAPAKPEGLRTAGSTTTDRTGIDGHAEGDYFDGFGGTSAAAPLVAGVAALLLSLNPELTRDDVQRILEHTADKIDRAHAAYDAAGFSVRAGHGRVNAARALVPSVEITVTPARVAAGEPFSVTVAASAPFGLKSVAWRGAGTRDAALDVLREAPLGGEAYRSITWRDLTIERPGTYAFEAFAEDLLAAEHAPGYPHRDGTDADELASLTVVERADDDSR
ncbi:MAG TPA: S8 family serine peptidase [Gammaproteobacteria bacterium]|nr:S8 family serine peptidase [Gammaproteobacteria bacterium]